MKKISFPILRKWFLLLTLFVFLTLILLWFLPDFRIQTVMITGNKEVTEDEIFLLLKEPVGKPFLKMWTEPLKERLLLHPWIKQAEVCLRFPRTIDIKISERETLVYMPYYGRFLAVAEDGTSLELISELQKNQLLFSGIDLPFLAIGEKIPNQEFLEGLDQLVGQMDPSVRQMISEIRRDTEGFFYLNTADDYRIRVDSTITKQQLIDMRAIVLFMREQGTRGMVLLQEGTPVFIPAP